MNAVRDYIQTIRFWRFEIHFKWPKLYWVKNGGLYHIPSCLWNLLTGYYDKKLNGLREDPRHIWCWANWTNDIFCCLCGLKVTKEETEINKELCEKRIALQATL